MRHSRWIVTALITAAAIGVFGGPPLAAQAEQLDGAVALYDSTITAAVDAVRTAVMAHVEKYRRSQPQ
jgi:hypothetical protein